MATVKAEKKVGKAAKPLKTTSPFKDHAAFEKEIKDFANRYKTIVVNQAKRTSDYFEMSCFNSVVKFYELSGYTLQVMNLIDGKYRYKCSPAGIQSNFSFFQAAIDLKGGTHEVDIQHNLPVQSSQDKDIYTTPDVAVIRAGQVKYTKEYYDTKTTFSFVENHDLFTFCEVKQFTPFPELLFNFIGVLNELRNEYMTDNGVDTASPHIAPSLMISGKPNKQTTAIKKSLEGRYCINILFDLFYSESRVFSKTSVSQLRKAGKKP